MMYEMESFLVENFQSHMSTFVKFAPAGQLTIFIGRSRSGKTAILRDLRWVLYNSPRGVAVPSKAARAEDSDEKSGYCRVGALFIRGTLKYTSGHTIIRERTLSKNQYRILYPESERREMLVLEGFGDSVPLEVQEITGVRPIKIGDTEINLNLSEQLDGPFLGSKSISASARAKVLGKLAGTEEIDFAGKTLGTDLHRRKRDKEGFEEDARGLDLKIAGYGWLDGYGRRIVELEGLAGDIVKAQERKKDASTFKDDFIYVAEEIEKCQWIVDRWKGVEEAEGFALKVAEAVARVDRVARLKVDFKGCVVLVDDCVSKIHRWRDLDYIEDATLKAEMAEIRRERAHGLQGRLFDAEERIRYYSSLLEARRNLDEAEKVGLEAERLAERLRVIRKFKTAMVDADTNCRWEIELLAGLSHVEQAESVRADAAALFVTLDVLKAKQQYLKHWRYALMDVEAEVDGLAGVDEAAAMLAEVLTLKGRWSKAYDHRIAVGGLESLVKEYRQAIVVHECRVAELEGAYKDALLSLGVCPLCQQPISDKEVMCL